MIIRRAVVWLAGFGSAVLASATLLSACDGVDNSEIFTEPILVHGAQFISGDLPKASGGAGAPAITAITLQNTTLYSGEAGWQLSGDALDNASAVAIRLGDLGTGYWLLPMSNPDPVLAGQLTFGALVDFSSTIVSGLHPLRIIAVTSSGEYGAESDQNLCIASRLPANPASSFLSDITACVPKITPPAAVFALTWDADVDLDLHVITPAGVDVNPKAPFVNPVDAGGTAPKLDPRIDRDSLASCVPDGWREEDLVFPTRPASGSVFQIKANLFSACGLPAVSFALTTYESVGTAGVDAHLVQTFKKAGTLNAIDALGDASGLLITSYPF